MRLDLHIGPQHKGPIKTTFVSPTHMSRYRVSMPSSRVMRQVGRVRSNRRLISLKEATVIDKMSFLKTLLLTLGNTAT